MSEITAKGGMIIVENPKIPYASRNQMSMKRNAFGNASLMKNCLIPMIKPAIKKGSNAKSMMRV
jgi:beta-lactamase class A